MTDFDTLLAMAPYAMGREEKQGFLTRQLVELSAHHAQRCPEYGRMLEAWLGPQAGRMPRPQEGGVCSQGQVEAWLQGVTHYTQLPFLPVRLFKEFSLRSVPEESLHKTMTSSGTTGQQVSRIYLDRETSTAQSKVLGKIVSDFLGGSRHPMIILDTSALLQNRAMFSARGAGVLGFSMLGRDKMYALDQDMRLDVEGLKAFLEKHRGETIFLFGFTFMVWQHFYQELLRLGYQPDLSQGVLIHGGGWKKLAQQAVSPAQFKVALREACGITRVHDYYGMVEQTGTIYMECQEGHLHAPQWADVTIRHPQDFGEAARGQRGLIQVASLLPRSYPGHLLLTEDEGAIVGEDDCPCGRKGKYFTIYGRIQRAELRGCSDTYENP